MIFDMAEIEAWHLNALGAACYPSCSAIFLNFIIEISQYSQQRPIVMCKVILKKVPRKSTGVFISKMGPFSCYFSLFCHLNEFL